MLQVKVICTWYTACITVQTDITCSLQLLSQEPWLTFIGWASCHLLVTAVTRDRTILCDHLWMVPVFTTRQRNCGKVMFSVVSVSHSVHSGGVGWGGGGEGLMWSLPMMYCTSPNRDPGHGTSMYIDPPPYPGTIRHGTSLYRDTMLVISGGQDWRPVQTCSLQELPPPVVLTSGSYWSTYDWHAGGAHPTGMLSCYTFGPVRSWFTETLLTISTLPRYIEHGRTLTNTHCGKLNLYQIVLCVIFHCKL